MLDYSGAQELIRGWRRGTELSQGDAVVLDLRERFTESTSRPVATSPGEVPPEHRSPSGTNDRQPEISRSDRRAVGRTLSILSHALDFVALVIPLLLHSISNAKSAEQLNPLYQAILLSVYGAVGTLLLWPTVRRGRMAVTASEGLLSIVGRVCLTPIFTLLIAVGTQAVHGYFFGRNRDLFKSFDVATIAVITAVTVPLVLIGRLISSKLVDLVRSKGYDLEDVIVLGTGPVGVQVAEALLENPQFGLVPCGFVDRFDDEMPLPLLGRPEDLREILQRSQVRHVVLAFGAAEEHELVGIIRRCQDQVVQFYAVPRLFELGVSADSVGHELSGLPIVEVRRPGSASTMWPAKRAFDVVVAGFIAVISLPVLAGCALAVRLSSRGPIFFKQVRIGVGGQPFEILKFRTMRVNDDSATQWSVDDDDRVTLVGKILRPTHLDELPQLFNVLRGEMSLVGPRPERPHFVEQFSSEINEYEYRHRVPVGITGWAQVNGYWGDTSIETRVRLDNRYIENWSLWRDLVIGFKTIPTLLGKRR